MSSKFVHGGQVHRVAQQHGKPISKILDFSASINPLGLSPSIYRAFRDALPLVAHYPDSEAYCLRKSLAEFYGISLESLVVGNGSAELIFALPRALDCKHGLVIGPTFMEFERALNAAEARCTYVHATRETQYRPPIDEVCRRLSKGGKRPVPYRRTISEHRQPPVDIVFLCNPNSPTGRVSSRRQILQLLEATLKSNIYVVIDEAFVEFCAHYSVLKQIRTYQRLIVLRSFTKLYGMPGIRIGYLVGSPGVVQRVMDSLPPWSVNTLAQEAARVALFDKDFRERSVTLIKQERKRFSQQLRSLPGLRIYPSSANFFIIEFSSYARVRSIESYLREKGILIRDCQNFSGMLAPTIRVAIRHPRENDQLVTALKQGLMKCR